MRDWERGDDAMLPGSGGRGWPRGGRVSLPSAGSSPSLANRRRVVLAVLKPFWSQLLSMFCQVQAKPDFPLMAKSTLGHCPSKWWQVPESNRGHKDFQSSALPTELSCQPGRILNFALPFMARPEFNRNHSLTKSCAVNVVQPALGCVGTRFSRQSGIPVQNLKRKANL